MTPGGRWRDKPLIWRSVGVALLIGLMYLGHAVNALLPTPDAVAVALGSMLATPEFLQNLGVSLLRVFAGLATAAAAAAILSFLGYLSTPVRGLTEGVLGLIRPIPPIAWIPLSVAIFGLSEASSVFVIFIGAFFPIFSSSIQALTFEGKLALRLAQMIRGPAVRHFFDVVIPASLPTIFTGLGVAIGFAWMVVVVAEMIAVKSGLGYQIQIERQLLRLDYVVAYMVVIGVVGAALGAAAVGVQNLLMPYLRKEGIQDDEASDPAVSDADHAPLVDHGPAIAMRGVEFAYGPSRKVLSDVNLEVAAGELVAIVGASGSGKTTLLKVIAGEIEPTAGIIAFEPPALARQAPGWVIQGQGLFEWMTVRKNIAFGIPLHLEKGRYPLDAWLSLTGLTALAGRFPGSLSGGQRQRVQIARALASRRELILLDEPFSALDAIAREALLPAMRLVFKDAGRTCILVTHDLRDAIRFADRVCVLGGGASAIVGAVEIRRPPRDSAGRELPISTHDISAHFETIWTMLERGHATAR